MCYLRIEDHESALKCFVEALALVPAEQQPEHGTLLNNIGTRDVPSPVTNPICGSVVSIVIEGTLSVPFLGAAGTGAPSVDNGDPNEVASIGGRYRFQVAVQ